MGHKSAICFVALSAYNILSGRRDLDHVGGAEVQQLQMATWFARQGYPVSFVTLDHGQPDGVEISGIKVYKAYAKDTGIRGLRFVHPRWTGLWAALKRANAEVYYHRGAECESGQVGLWCRLHHRRFIFAAANDSDCDSTLYALTSRREKILYRLGLRLANAVTAQTVTQQTLLKRNMGVAAVVIRNCGPALAGQVSPRPPSLDAGGSLRVLWVGRISEQKRLEWLLDVAETCPDIACDVVGAPNEDSAYSSSVIRRAAGILNVKMHGQVVHDEIAGFFQRSHVLCCTSAYEGFPNTFLEAWSWGVPVVSTFDPDGAIAANGLGWTADSVEGIIARLREVAQSPDAWMEASKAALQYYQANHTPEVCLPAFERLLLHVAGCEGSPT
jgi:glycosyltransferase involved in cell wall biosynthesis